MIYLQPFLTILIVSLAFASPLHRRQDFTTGLLDTLNRTNATTLSLVLQQYFTTDLGRKVASTLSNGEHTIFAPSDVAMNPAVLNEKPDTLGPILLYHLVNGSYPPESFATPRTHTIAPTFLVNQGLKGAPQIQVLERGPGTDVLLVRGTTRNGTITTSTKYQNIVVHGVDTLLALPDSLKAALSSVLVGRAQRGFGQFRAVLNKVGLLNVLSDRTAITVFVPIDDAFGAISSTIANLPPDRLSPIVNNHILFDRVIYSDALLSTPSTVAASQVRLDFSTEAGVLYVSYNRVRARVLRSDVPIRNGVVYVIDRVLA